MKDVKIGIIVNVKCNGSISYFWFAMHNKAIKYVPILLTHLQKKTDWKMCELLSNVYFITISFWWLFPAAMQPRILERVFDAFWTWNQLMKNTNNFCYVLIVRNCLRRWWMKKMVLLTEETKIQTSARMVSGTMNMGV